MDSDDVAGGDPIGDRGHTPLPDDPDAYSSTGLPEHLRPTAIGLVFVGGVLGTAGRYGIETALPQHGTGWPTGTFIANLVGAFVLGVLLEALTRIGPDTGWRRRIRLFVGTGGCGAFTTYSTLALEVSLLGRDSAFGTAIAYALVSVVGGLIAVWLGIAVAASIRHRAHAAAVS